MWDTNQRALIILPKLILKIPLGQTGLSGRSFAKTGSLHPKSRLDNKAAMLLLYFIIDNNSTAKNIAKFTADKNHLKLLSSSATVGSLNLGLFDSMIVYIFSNSS